MNNLLRPLLKDVLLKSLSVSLNGSITSYKDETPSYISCYATGEWIMNGVWYNKDIWRMGTEIPSFLPLGRCIYNYIFKYSDRIKFPEN